MRIKHILFGYIIFAALSGIGLAVVDEIIRLHNGEFEISSILGEGTTVKITLPLEPAIFAESRAESEGDISTDE